MKKLLFYLFALCTLLFLCSTTLAAQDGGKMNAGDIETLADTVLVRSVVVTLDPGEEVGPMTHPAYFAYILKGGKFQVTYGDSEPMVIDFPDGFSMYGDPEGPHYTKNIGEEPVQFLLVELKEHPYVATGSKE